MTRRATPETGTRVTITARLAVAVGHVAALHPDDALTIEWSGREGERVWEVMTDGTKTRQVYKIDDETGHVLSVGWWG